MKQCCDGLAQGASRRQNTQWAPHYEGLALLDRAGGTGRSEAWLLWPGALHHGRWRWASRLLLLWPVLARRLLLAWLLPGLWLLLLLLGRLLRLSRRLRVGLPLWLWLWPSLPNLS